MKSGTFYVSLTLASLFAIAGISCAAIDLKDIWKVDPTPTHDGAIAEPSDKPMSINQAKREVEVVRDSTNRWIKWRNADIAKEEQKVGFIEGIASSGLNALGDTVGQWAGPVRPLATLLIGYATKRRKDRTPDEVAKEKEDSYNAGFEKGRSFGDVIAETAKSVLDKPKTKRRRCG